MSECDIQSILPQFHRLFNICKFLGIYPYDFRIFEREHNLHSSRHGTWLVYIAILIVTVCYCALIRSFAEDDSDLKKTQSTLTLVIGIFLTYIGLVMMAIDQLTAIRNQRNINELYDRIKAVDIRLSHENVQISNDILGRRISWLLAITVAFELSIMVSTYILLIDYSQWVSLLWFFSCFPTLYNSLDKIWFAVTLLALKERFKAINTELEQVVATHERFIYSSNDLEGYGGDFNAEYSSQLAGTAINEKSNRVGKVAVVSKSLRVPGLSSAGSTKIAPIAHSMNSFGEEIVSSKQTTKATTVGMVYESQLCSTAFIEAKLTNVCQIHDELCEIGKTLNELWGFPLLVLMGYGFLIFTAQLYFLYCATQDQTIPSLFRSAKSAVITAIYLSYTSGKCIYLIYLSWRTTLQSKRTGICIHKCCVIANFDCLYEAVNHLSLKLLNHAVGFSACGFFSLDMEMLYGVSGGITSYLIILIQFNLAAQQAKEAIRGINHFNETANIIAGVAGNPVHGILPMALFNVSSTVATTLFN